jgi:hypothetical protein
MAPYTRRLRRLMAILKEASTALRAADSRPTKNRSPTRLVEGAGSRCRDWKKKAQQPHRWKSRHTDQ